MLRMTFDDVDFAWVKGRQANMSLLIWMELNRKRPSPQARDESPIESPEPISDGYRALEHLVHTLIY